MSPSFLCQEHRPGFPSERVPPPTSVPPVAQGEVGSAREGLEAAVLARRGVACGNDRGLAAGDLQGKDKCTPGRARPCAGLPVSAARSRPLQGHGLLSPRRRRWAGRVPGWPQDCARRTGQAIRGAAGPCGVETTGDAGTGARQRPLGAWREQDAGTAGPRASEREPGTRCSRGRPSRARHVAVSGATAVGGRCVSGQIPRRPPGGGGAAQTCAPAPTLPPPASPRRSGVSTVRPELQIISLILLCVYFALFWPDIRNFV